HGLQRKSVVHGEEVIPTAAGVIYEAFQGSKTLFFNMQMRQWELFGLKSSETITRMRINYNDDGSIPLNNPVVVQEEAPKGFVGEATDIFFDFLSGTPLFELSATRSMSAAGSILAARGPAFALRVTEDLYKSSSGKVGQYAKDMKDMIKKGEDPWESFPAVEVVNDNGTLLIKDGHHRVMAARAAEIKVNYKEVTVSDTYLDALRAGSSEARVKLDWRKIKKIMNNE
ncbi:MAG: hypothetical protein AAFO07_33235, partial [Bacteroidota bacterium]